MIHTRVTLQLNHISEATEALETVLSSPSPEEKQRSADTLRLAIALLEHKSMRIDELESELNKLKSNSKRRPFNQMEHEEEINSLRSELEHTRKALLMVQTWGEGETSNEPLGNTG